MVANGGPRYLGVGFGESQARRRGSCMFGARTQMRPDLTLGQIRDRFSEFESLLVELARVPSIS
jgi:hypothetical protein